MDIAASSNEFVQWMWKDGGAILKKNFQQFKIAREEGSYPTMQDLATITPVVVVGLFVFKFVLETLVLRPFARKFLKLKAEGLPFQEPKLEKIYTKNKPKLPDINEIKSLSKTFDKPVEELNRWFGMRQLIDRDRVKVQVCAGSLWRLLMYSVALGVNISYLRGKPWSKDVRLCWEDLPFQKVDPMVKYFYAGLEIPLYIVLLILQLIEGRNAKDHWEMTAHHTLVIVLVTLVYLGNFTRIGMIGLALHDVTDLFIEGSKLANLFRYKGLADLLFAGFTLSWAYARIYKFTVTVYASILADGLNVIGPAINAFAVLLAILSLLNMYWFLKIAKLAYRIYWTGISKERQQRDFTDLSTDDEVDSDSSYLSDADNVLKKHEQ